MSDMSAGKKGSVIFSGFRALGLYSNHLAHVLRFHKKHREFYVLTAVGQCFHTYNVKKLGIVAVSNALPEDISSLAADRMLVYAAYGKLICAFAKNKEVVHTYTGHQADVHLLLPFGDHLISVDKDNVVIIWDVESEDTYLQISYDKASFEVSALMHPSTYLNKILFGSSQGSLQLWNIKSNKLLFTFPGWASAVTVLQQTPAVDVVGVGLASGQIIIHNIRFDETLMKFQQDWGPVTALSFRTDGHPIMASGSPIGHIGLWDLEEKKFVTQMRNAHTTAIAGLTFLQNEPLLITNGADNAIRVWIFDVAGGDGRLLRQRTGHSAPPTKIQHHDQSSLNILSAGQDGTLQSFSTVHERFNKSLGHGTLNKTRAKKKGVTNDTAKLPAITTFTFSPDGRWLITASMDCTIRTWDLPSGSLVDCFLVDAAAVSLSMSPTGNFLASSHVDGLGIYLWSNNTLCSLVSLRPLPADYEPTVIMLPGTCPSRDTEEEDVLDAESSEMAEYISPAQLDEHLITLSLLPDSRWKNLLHLDIIKKKNKPKEPPKLPKAAPFFIPTIPGLVPQFALPSTPSEDQSKIVNLGVLAQKSTFYLQLENTLDNNSYEEPVKLLRELGPSAIETELRSLSPDMGGDVRVMQSFLKMISSILQSKRDFDLAQAYLALFLKLHLRFIADQPELMEEAESVSAHLEETWMSMQTLLNQNICVLSYIKSALL
ncbi:WD repeat-containing protein 36-like [Sinocyclocheilus rhinocerous]|uniref:WD repeat-containing protein 36-like n=1 Tax=Sinocyclocheilus rhinocerous TaxID=307959 RepID=UPI0007B8715B|nr:PREDICTED: WD repeat-containing protein 36-like [Sinocyclocheilus rhinocerous]